MSDAEPLAVNAFLEWVGQIVFGKAILYNKRYVIRERIEKQKTERIQCVTLRRDSHVFVCYGRLVARLEPVWVIAPSLLVVAVEHVPSVFNIGLVLEL